MLELTFNPFKKGALSFGKQEKPVNYFSGTIWEVRPEFMDKFLKGKREEPSEKDRVKNLGKMSGFWDKGI